MKVQYCSDLHLEFDNSPVFSEYLTPVGDILILAGDIGNPFYSSYEAFLRWCSCNFQIVLIIAGNHEYYGSTILLTEEKIESIIESIPKVFFLQKKTLTYEKYRFIGCTFWSCINEEARNPVEKYVSDFRSIDSMTVDKYNEINADHSLWVKGQIKHCLNNGLTPILITHHPLTIDTLKRCVKITDCAFENNFDLHGVKYAIAGHIHEVRNFNIDGCKVLINCRGYKDNKRYLKSAFFELYSREI